MSDFAKLLKKNGLNKSEFADLVGYHPNQVTRWKDNPPKWVLLLLEYRQSAIKQSASDQLHEIKDKLRR